MFYGIVIKNIITAILLDYSGIAGYHDARLRMISVAYGRVGTVMVVSHWCPN